jgi:glycerophosphoryl diester phosphodiesterase
VEADRVDPVVVGQQQAHAASLTASGERRLNARWSVRPGENGAVPSHPYLDHDGPIPFAHRGGASEAPENTLPAFEYAVGLGYRYLETDVHATADGRLVAFHDASLDRVTDRRGRIAELRWSEVARAMVDGRAPIPLLTDLFEAFPDARINIDCKSDGAVDPLVRAVRATGSIDRVCIGAFSDRRLARLRRELGPGLCSTMGPGEVARLRIGSLVPGGTGLVGRAAACIQVPVAMAGIPVVDRRSVATAAHLGLPVHVWTIDDATEMHRLLDLGVAGIMTDRPAVLRDVLQARGHWRT